MTQVLSAAARLRLGDELDRQAASAPVRVVAQRAGLSEAAAEKARWLARSYGPAERAAVGADALALLTGSHLEAAGPARAARAALLRRAADERLSVRELRALAGRAAAPAVPHAPAGPAGSVAHLGAAGDLSSASASLARYAAWSDRQLRHLLSGPNGPLVRELALAGRQLAERLEAAI